MKITPINTIGISRPAYPSPKAPQPVYFTGNAPNKKFDRNAFAKPTPSYGLMRMLGPVNQLVMLSGIPLLREIPLLKRIPGIGGISNVVQFDFPKDDLQRLKMTVNRGTAAFIGPNHPEFFTDWMLDKYVAGKVAPRLASWATHTVVNAHPLGQKFWLKNNLVAQIPGTGGKEGKAYSIQSALKGDGVLLHPEGSVRWTSDKVHKLFDGIVSMAIEAAQNNPTDRPVFVTPIVWKLRFTRDVSKGLHREMKEVEQRLGLPANDKKPLGERFYALQVNLLDKQEDRFNVTPEFKQQQKADPNFFSRQARFRDNLLQQLVHKYGPQEGDLDKQVYRLEKAAKLNKDSDPEGYKADKRKAAEIKRLMGFTEAVYNTPKLTQEHIAESLKRIKRDLFNKGFRDALNNMVPRPVGPRVAHIRVPDPINITDLVKQHVVLDDTTKTRLLEKLQARMQAAIDQVNRQYKPQLDRFSVPNPFYASPNSKLITIIR